MRRVITLVALLSLAGLAAAANSPLQTCPEFPLPKKVKVQSIAEQMDFNGIPMSVQRIESQEAPKAVLGFYRQKWAATEKIQAAVEYALGPWQVIASQRGDCFYTVQAREFGKNGTEALLGITAPPGKPAVREQVPVLPGSTIANDIGHNDQGKTARTVLVQNGFSTATNMDFYRRNLTDQGWRVTTHYRLAQPDRLGDVMILRNGVRELSITATRSPQNGNEANVVLNYVDQP